MKPMTQIKLLAVAVLTGLLFGCGGGGGEGTVTSTIKARTSGAYTGKVYGVQFTVALPAGISLSNGQTAPGVVTASGNAAGSEVTANVTGNTLTVLLTSAIQGFDPGEFATITVNSATAITAADFPTPTGVVIDDHNASSGLTVTFQ